MVQQNRKVETIPIQGQTERLLEKGSSCYSTRNYSQWDLPLGRPLSPRDVIANQANCLPLDWNGLRTEQCWRSLCPREISEEVEDERVGLVRCFQRDEMRGASDFDVAGVR